MKMSSILFIILSCSAVIIALIYKGIAGILFGVSAVVFAVAAVIGILNSKKENDE